MIRLVKHYSLEHASEILYLVNKRLNLTKFAKYDGVLSVECWANGREQGYCVVDDASERKLVVAQQRNSDQILVIFGDSKDFDISTNMPNNNLWRGAGSIRYFNKDEDAAKFIVDYFTDKIKE